MEKIIFGGSILGEIAYKILSKDSNTKISGVYDDRTPSDFFLGLIQGNLNDLLLREKKSDCGVFVAIGDNLTRKAVSISLMDAGFTLLNIIDSKAVIEESRELGFGNLIMANSYLGSSVRIGDGNIIFPGACITHHNLVGSYNFFSPNSTIGGFTTIGNNCKIGINSVVSPYIRVADGTEVRPLNIHT